MANDPQSAGDKVAILIRTVEHGGNALETFPAILRQLIEDGSWEHFSIKGKDVRPRSFAEFLTSKPLDGIGAESVEQVKDLIRSDKWLRQKVTSLCKHQGNKQPLVDSTRGGATRRDETLDRLERDAPDLYDAVLREELSANAAAVNAGFRPRRISIRTDDPASITASLRRNLKPDVLRAVANMINET